MTFIVIATLTTYVKTQCMAPRLSKSHNSFYVTRLQVKPSRARVSDNVADVQSERGTICCLPV